MQERVCIHDPPSQDLEPFPSEMSPSNRNVFDHMSGETRTNRSYRPGFRLDFWLAAVALISCLFSFPILAAAQRADNFGRVNDGGDRLALM